MNSNAQSILSYCLGITIVLTTIGCEHGKISPRASQYAQAIYTASNLQNSKNIVILKERINTDRESGELSTKDATVLQRLLMQAKSGNWEQAMLGARRLMQDQVNK